MHGFGISRFSGGNRFLTVAALTRAPRVSSKFTESV
jgi:hypothetical protein